MVRHRILTAVAAAVALGAAGALTPAVANAAPRASVPSSSAVAAPASALTSAAGLRAAGPAATSATGSAGTAQTARTATATAAAAPASAVRASAATASATVCTLTCDGEAVTPTTDAVPVPAVTVAGRTLQFHAALDQGVGWGRLTAAQSGDRVWVERSFDGGATTARPVPAVAATASGDLATAPANLADPTNHRRAVLRACATVAGADSCTRWAYPGSVNGRVADGSAPDRSADQQPVAAATTTNRSVRLHVGGNGAAWASVDAAVQGDAVWVERSWNAGISASGGHLGAVTVPAGATTASTAAFVAAEPRLKLYGGAVRACAQVAAAQTTACTAWARPAVNRLAAAVDALAYEYEPYTAWWPSSWWNSAVAITTVIDYQRQTGDPTYAWMIDRTFEVNRRAYPAGVKSGDELPGNFVSRAIDDGMWWGFAWTRAYDLTGDAKYLQMAEIIGNYSYGYWDTTVCGGGVWWDGERTYKNAVVNGQFIRLAAELHNRIPGDYDWLNRAVDGWNWYQKVGLAGAGDLVNDGLDSTTCGNNGSTVWSYNQGLAIGDGVELYRATGDPKYLDRATQLATAAMTSSTLTVGGILTESCDQAGAQNPCDDNQKQFKGIFMRYLQDLNSVTGGVDRAYANAQADSIWSKDRDALNRLGERWQGAASASAPNPRDWRTQASALSGLLAKS